MGFNGVNHLAMATGDMDKTIRFWRDLLGMRLVAGLGEPGYRHYFFEISKDDLIAFFETLYRPSNIIVSIVGDVAVSTA